MSYKQTGLEVGRVLFLFLRCNKKRAADVFGFCLLRHAANQAVACLGGASRLTNKPASRWAGFCFFFDVTRKEQQMSSFLLRHAANQAVACLGGASCLTNKPASRWAGCRSFFFDVTRTEQQMSSFCYSDTQLTMMLRCLGGASCLTNKPASRWAGCCPFSSM